MKEVAVAAIAMPDELSSPMQSRGAPRMPFPHTPCTPSGPTSSLELFGVGLVAYPELLDIVCNTL